MSQIKITPALLSDLRQKAEAATEGPWRVRIQEVQNSCTGRLRKASWIVRTDGSHLPYNDDDGIANNQHIAAANPAVVLALVAEVERLRDRLDAIECPNCGHPPKFCMCNVTLSGNETNFVTKGEVE